MKRETLLEDISLAVRMAGEIIRPVTHTDVVKAKPGSANFVTEYDSRVQDFLIRTLSALVPDAEFVGEEDGYSDHKAGGPKTFIIDPIDGTTNFLCHYMESGISVAYAEDGDPVIGVVYNPFRGELFTAEKGKGAFLNGRRLQIPDLPLEGGTFSGEISPYNPEMRDEVFDRLKKISYHCMDFRDTGSAALSICYVACGRSVAYLSSRLCVWDYAAAHIILTEAGGVLTSFDGAPLKLRNHTSVYAATPKALEQLLNM